MRRSVGFSLYRFIHDDDGGCAQGSFCTNKVIKIHQHIVTHMARDNGSGGAPRNDTQQVVPAAPHSACPITGKEEG